MDEKIRLMVALSAPEESVTELCEDFAISADRVQVVAALLEGGAAGLKELSHAPQVVPWAINQARQRRSWDCAGRIELGTKEVASQA